MITHFIEATNNDMNWGKFMLARFDSEEWARLSHIERGRFLLSARGWTPEHILVLDIETGEGAIFLPGGGRCPTYDLEKHAVWVCPLFEPFLHWLYQQNTTDLSTLPRLVQLPDAEFALKGHRRKGRKNAPET